MCNMYSMVSNKEAIREFAKFLRVSPHVDNLPEIPGIYANGWGPIVRATDDGARELAAVRWGLPTPQGQLKGVVDSGTTNLRTLRYWKRYLEPLNRRCVVPVTSFCEPDQVGETYKNHWFALDESRPLFFFAGAWLPDWQSVRKKADGPTTDSLYAFLTTDANADVRPIHSKAMPVILRTPEEVERWFTIPYAEIEAEMQNPLPNGTLKVVNIGPKTDGAEPNDAWPPKAIVPLPLPKTEKSGASAAQGDLF
ncbi:MAG: SOS response-associated peptidase [Asticcacaulis sp.]|uniref:SOS response-associated peptidase family protein n=1 Tax=Asticcacaulis sp. TaxID=1872648 RepID=UPI0039E4C6C2